MKLAKLLILACCTAFLMTYCKSADTVSETPSKDRSIIGSWKGCDGRVVTFSKDENDEIVGRYNALGRLGAYHFSENEIGYRVTLKAAGSYEGKVKWRSTSGDVSWKNVSIKIEDNTYTDSGSDNCSKEMKRIRLDQGA